MEALLGFLLVTYVLTRAVSTAKLDHTYAKQGQVSPRLKAKYGDGAQAKVAKYGFFDFARDAWNDYWPRRTEALIAARNAKATNPGERVSWWDRWAAATNVITTVGRKLVDPVPVKADRMAAEPTKQSPADDLFDQDELPELEPVVHEPGTWTVDDHGQRVELTPAQPKPCAGECGKPSAGLGSLHDLCDDCGAIEAGVSGRRPTENTATTGGTMTDSGLEASNYETAVPALDSLTAATQNLSDHVAGAKVAAAQFNDQVNEIDVARRNVESAAQSVMEQLSARNLDASTMSAVTSAMELIRAGDLSGAMDHIDAAAAMLANSEAAAIEASGAVASASQTVVSKYGDAHVTVASELSGDASFLGSGGGAAGGTPGASGGSGGHGGAPAGSGGSSNRGGSAASDRPALSPDSAAEQGEAAAKGSASRTGLYVGEGDNVTFTGVIGGPSSGVKVPKGPKGPGSNSVISHGGTINFKGIVGDGSTYNAGD